VVAVTMGGCGSSPSTSEERALFRQNMDRLDVADQMAARGEGHEAASVVLGAWDHAINDDLVRGEVTEFNLRQPTADWLSRWQPEAREELRDGLVIRHDQLTASMKTKDLEKASINAWWGLGELLLDERARVLLTADVVADAQGERNVRRVRQVLNGARYLAERAGRKDVVDTLDPDAGELVLLGFEGVLDVALFPLVPILGPMAAPR
ncbi:MAG: hypothetical protein AABZ53_11470, partial [Planctomycetota bacterium]